MTKAPQPLQNGQTTLDATRTLPQRPFETTNTQKGATEDTTMSDGTVDEQAAEAQRPGSSRIDRNGLVFEHYEPNGTSRKDESGDFEMN